MSSCHLFDGVLAYWRDLAAGADVPCYRAFDPAAVPPALPHLVVREGLPEAGDFRYRLIGGAVRAHISRSYVGLSMRAIAHQEPGSGLFEALRGVAASRAPRVYAPAYLGPDKRVRTVETLLLPFAPAEGAVDIIIAVVRFRQGNGACLTPPARALGARLAG